MKMTIKDIAEIAGVSKATVSRVLNNTKPVSDEIKERVQSVIDETGYRPSSLARSLSRQRTGILGLIIPDVANPFYAELVKGMSEVAKAYHYNILLCNTFREHEKEREFLELLEDKEVDGIIFMTFEFHKYQKAFFDRYRKPIVTVNRHFEGQEIPNVDIDNEAAAYSAVRYLIELGHRRVGIISSSKTDDTAIYRVDGYRRALEEAGLSAEEDLVVESDYHFKSAYEGARQLMTLEDPPTAIFCLNDELAVGAIKYLNDTGRSVPEDVSVIGFDDVPLASMFIPSLTTIRQPIYEMGATAARLLIKRVKDEPLEWNQQTLPFELVIRNSTAERRET